MSDKFKIGDVVKLKSGGPEMTVIEIKENEMRTVWFAGAKKQEAYFLFDVIDKQLAEDEIRAMIGESINKLKP